MGRSARLPDLACAAGHVWLEAGLGPRVFTIGGPPPCDQLSRAPTFEDALCNAVVLDQEGMVARTCRLPVRLVTP